jgi:hypothetical protein
VTTTEPALGATPRGPLGDRSRPRRWMVVLTVVWILILAVAAAFAIRGGGVTARDQTTVAAARPYVDEAVARVASAVGRDGQAVVAISAFEKVGDCDVSVFRGGVRYGRAATAVVAAGTESALLERVAAQLPASYGARVRTASAPRLTADAGYWVTLVGAVLRPGEVRFFADTGDCRVAGDVVTSDPPGPADRAAVESVLDQLGVTPSAWTASAVPCPSGGVTGTVQATGPAFTGAVDARLSSAGAVVAGPRLFAYRTGVAVRAHEDALLVSATTPCP